MKKINALRSLWTGLIILELCVVFFNSAQTGGASSGVSEGVTRVIAAVFVPRFQTMTVAEQAVQIGALHGVIRELAHAAEFVPLGLLSTLLLLTFPLNQRKFLFGLLGVVVFCLLCAVGDEIHQRFVEGRASEWFDVGMDMLGSMAGAIFVLLCRWIHGLYGRQQKQTVQHGRHFVSDQEERR